MHINLKKNILFKDIMKDLLNFAACNLVIGGRLVYWFPTTDL